jgi:hypothetical protein
MPVKIVRCVDCGENNALNAKFESRDWKLNVELELTATDIPQ